jgi:hypothetical protein
MATSDPEFLDLGDILELHAARRSGATSTGYVLPAALSSSCSKLAHAYRTYDVGSVASTAGQRIAVRACTRRTQYRRSAGGMGRNGAQVASRELRTSGFTGATTRMRNNIAIQRSEHTMMAAPCARMKRSGHRSATRRSMAHC